MKAGVLLGTLLASTALAQPRQARADVSFGDTEFPDGGWAVESITTGFGGSSSGVQSPTGNPGNARRITNSVNAGPSSISAMHRFGTTSATIYSPTTSGAVASLDFSVDYRLVSGFGDGQGLGFALKQGTVVYFAAYAVTGSDGAWHARSATGLLASDFVRMDGLAGTPNFSAAGANIRFGLAVSNSSTGAGYAIVVDYDNFAVTVRQVPGPASGALGLAAACGLGGVGGAGGRRRRR